MSIITKTIIILQFYGKIFKFLYLIHFIADTYDREQAINHAEMINLMLKINLST